MSTRTKDSVIATVTVQGHTLGYTEYGTGDRVVVITPAFMMSQRMQQNWAQALACHGYRVITVDMLGTTADRRPLPIDRYSCDALGSELIGILDALGIERATLAGTSLGANVCIEAAAQHPDRVVGLILEAPCLEQGSTAIGYLLSPGLFLFTAARPLVRLAGLLARSIPVDSGILLGMVRDVLVADPARTTALLRGLTFGRFGPPWYVRNSVPGPALVIGIRGDPFHPVVDARAVVDEIPGAILCRTPSLATLRLRPAAAVATMANFLETVWLETQFALG
ncbi:alpha/beta fold hydrolase [Nocardia altamirensis]|uniref:alpha/beta fold hydrolase n=1 Tax=Nocardia altamirensis TaxID=472158 RepID=UPI00083FF5B9|nr:alpha/beta fold hydrolase [Nocardia altamirensis]